MRITGNSMGLAPNLRKRSLNDVACSRVRVTRMRFPSNGLGVLVECGIGTSPSFIDCCDNRVRSLCQRLLRQLDTQLFGLRPG